MAASNPSSPDNISAPSNEQEVETTEVIAEKSEKASNDTVTPCTNVDTKNSDKQEAEVVVKPAAAAKKASNDSVSSPTYTETKDSEAYYEAKSKLNEGDFEQALTTIETAIQVTLSLLPDEDGSHELHDSLAPLYYLYGTTLLYSVEESNDMVVGSAEEEEGSDLQIAWENLDSARTIMERLDEKQDLAQVYQRLGDLQRANGNYKAAIDDYERCLEQRMQLTGLFHRTVADCHYSLGVAYMLSAAENEDSSENKIKSILHYFEGVRAFAGLIAISCGVEPESIASASVASTAGRKKAEPFLTGDISTITLDLKGIRSKLEPLRAFEEEQDTVDEWKEILDEIQETIENSDDSIKVLKDVNKNKQEHARTLKAQDDSPDGAQCSSTSATATSTTTIGFASAASSNVPQSNINTILTVKKKKRPPSKDADNDSKKPKPSAE